jgi:transmembrane sensor
MKRREPAKETVEAVAARWVARRDQGLTAAEEAELARWREEDRAHAAAMDRFEATWSALSRPRREGATAPLRRELERVRGRGRMRRRLTGAAVAAAIVLGAAGWRWSPAPAAAVTETPSFVVQQPERRTLPDGSTVELPANAAIAVDFGGALRRVRLVRGQAHFAVAKDPARAFVVEAGGVEVRAVGTAFAVHLEEGGVEVLVTEGRVAVAEPAAAAPPSDPAAAGEPPGRTLALVDAGNRVWVDPAGDAPAAQVSPVVPAELAERLAWRSPQVEFSGAALADVVAVLNRHNAVRFLIEDPAVARVRLSGLFRVDDPAVFTGLLESGFGIRTEVRGRDWILRRRPE